MLSLFARFVIVVTIVIAATDLIMFYVIQRNHTEVTLQLVIEIIIITIIPIVINLWYWLVLKKLKA